MKKFFTCFMIIFIMFLGLCPTTNTSFANEAGAGWEIKHQKHVVTISGVDCVSDINVSEAVFNGTDENGKDSYRKKVEIKNDFFLSGSDEYISGNLLHFYFVFNNDSVFLEGKNIMKDETFNFDKYWKTTVSEEIYNSPEQCIVSQRSGIYNRDTYLQNLGNTDEFHIDIICSTKGEISFNIKDAEISNNANEKVSKAVTKSKKLKKNLIRETSERDKQYIKDIESNNNDRYRYITREIYLAYKDNDGNLLADSTIQANFRYNLETHEVTCLSTSNEEQHGEIDVTMRTGNETRTYGGAYGEIKLKYSSNLFNKNFNEDVIIKCDSRGKIITQFLN